jgi:hypothetical protein
VLVQGGDPEQRRLAAAVGAEDEPTMFALYSEGQRADDGATVTHQPDIVEYERGGLHSHRRLCTGATDGWKCP